MVSVFLWILIPCAFKRVMCNYFFCFTFLKTTFIMKYYSFEYFFDIQRHFQRDSTQHTETYMKSLVVMANFSGWTYRTPVILQQLNIQHAPSQVQKHQWKMSDATAIVRKDGNEHFKFHTFIRIDDSTVLCLFSAEMRKTWELWEDLRNPCLIHSSTDPTQVGKC